ncbi:Arm DNA-binding domain-containing protein [Frateuria sp. GZRR35]|uniref:Arm DNA-binding domain-containing protein n=1 Tax=Frateuria sp. GZRR35 TaxID=3351536 RepID=UPI003EDBD4CB
MLTDAKLRSLKRQGTLYRVADRDGLCVEIPPEGSLCWRFRYRYQNRAKMISLGLYPAVSLAMARERLNNARALLTRGLDPSAERQSARRSVSKELDHFSSQRRSRRKVC